MNHNRLRMGSSFLTAALVACGGCGSGKSPGTSPSKVEAKVTGKVIANGSPVAKGKVTVSPPGPPFVERIVEIQKDGSYEITTFVGKNSFSVIGTGTSGEGRSYNKKDFDVNEGLNSIDLTLPLVDK